MGAGRSNCLSSLRESRRELDEGVERPTGVLEQSARGRRLASRVPRYHQIAQTLRERIVASGHGPGKRLDTQRSLAREFGVTLMTLRQALDLLERDGLIARRHGLG